MLKLYNTLSNKKQKFKPIEPGKVRLYTCGPTVYNYAHIGNLSAYIFADILRRYLEFSGYEVRHIVNITDVGHLTADDVNQADSGEDKMLKAALREKKSPEEIANFYTEAFFQDIKKLNIKKAQYYPRATAHIDQMIKTIEALIEKGFAYEKNGNVFFDVEKFSEYGKLSNKKVEDLKHGARLEEHPDKKNPYDFTLWLKAPKKHLLKWNSPWSLGYPGWHIECSAMSMEYLGETLDIHTGGEDHIFPHHENEIAQSECSTGKEFSRFWFHNHFLLVDGQKMSKSKDNFYILQSIEEKGYLPMIFRLLILSSHYRSNINFTWDAMDQARANYEKIARFVETLEGIAKKGHGQKRTYQRTYVNTFLNKFQNAMDDDLNTPLALSAVYELISQVNKDISENNFNASSANEALESWRKVCKVFGLVIKKEDTSISNELNDLLSQRKEARKEKDFNKADSIRTKIEKLGYLVEDTKTGQKIRNK